MAAPRIAAQSSERWQESEAARILEDTEANFAAIHQRLYSGPGHPEDPGHPNRLPLKRRLADYRRAALQQPGIGGLGAFTVGVLGVEKFRDLTPAFVVAVFEEFLVLEPGDVGPIPYYHPVARELVRAINGQVLTSGLMAVLRDSGAPFYDGCLVVGLVDYRRQSFGVATAGAPPNAATTTASHHHRISMIVNKDVGLNGSSTGILRNPAVAPEMHKILLRPTYETVVGEIEESGAEGLAIEAELLPAVSGPLCLDPRPVVAEVLQALHYNRGKMLAALGPLQQVRMSPGLLPAAASTRLAALPAHHHKFRLAGLIEAQHASKRLADAEPYYGLDVKKDPSRFKESRAPLPARVLTCA